MPYLKSEDKTRLEHSAGTAKTPGDWNYLYTKAMIKTWTAKPQYSTIHAIKTAVRNAGLVEEIMEVESLLVALNVPQEDRFAARELAFMEFYRRIVSNYEIGKSIDNGDVYAGVPFASTGLQFIARNFTDKETEALDTPKVSVTGLQDKGETDGNDNRPGRKSKSR